MEQFQATHHFGASVIVDFRDAGILKNAKIIKTSFSKEKTFYDLEITLVKGWTTRIYNVDSSFVDGIEVLGETKYVETKKTSEFIDTVEAEFKKKHEDLIKTHNELNDLKEVVGHTHNDQEFLKQFEELKEKFIEKMAPKIKRINKKALTYEQILRHGLKKDNPVSSQRGSNIRSIEMLLTSIQTVVEEQKIQSEKLKKDTVSWTLAQEYIDDYIVKIRKKLQTLKD